MFETNKDRFINVFTRKLVTVTRRFESTINFGTKKETIVTIIEYKKDIPTLITHSIDGVIEKLFDFCKEIDDFNRTHMLISDFNRENNTRLV